MKKIFFLFCVWVFVPMCAFDEYDFEYEVYNKGQKVGILHATCIKEAKGLYKFSTVLQMDLQELLNEYSYTYKEYALLNKGKLISLLAYENENGIKREINLLASNGILQYPHGTKVPLAKIDYYPFDFKANIFKHLKKKRFIVNTFDIFSGKIITQKLDLINVVQLKNQKAFTFKLDDTTTKTYLKDGTVLEFTTKEYTAIQKVQ